MTSPSALRSSPGGQAEEPGVLRLLFGFVVCVLFPLLVTWLSPASWIVLTRSGDGPADAEVYSTLLLVLPVERAGIEAVETVKTSITEGRYVEVPGRLHVSEPRYRWAAATGELLLQGARGELSVSVSPATLDSSRAKIEDFLGGRGERRILFTVSDWTVGFFFALPFCLLAVAWVCGTTLLLMRRTARALRA